jgi:hypothetical protein
MANNYALKATIIFISSAFFLYAGYPSSADARDLVAASAIIPPHSIIGRTAGPKAASLKLSRRLTAFIRKERSKFSYCSSHEH